MASTQFHSSTSSDAEILNAFKTIAKELRQDPEQCGVTIHVMNTFSETFLLSESQNQPIVQYVTEAGGASWTNARIDFKPSLLGMTLNRDPKTGDDQISVSYDAKPPDFVEVSRSLMAIQRQFVPLNRAAAIEQALGPEMAEFYRRREEGLVRLESLAQRIVKETHDYKEI